MGGPQLAVSTLHDNGKGNPYQEQMGNKMNQQNLQQNVQQSNKSLGNGS